MKLIIRENEIGNGFTAVMLGDDCRKQMKKLLVKAFGKEHGEYLVDYGMIYDGKTASIELNKVQVKDIQEVVEQWNTLELF